MADDCADNEEQRPVAAAGSSYMLVSILAHTVYNILNTNFITHMKQNLLLLDSIRVLNIHIYNVKHNVMVVYYDRC